MIAYMKRSALALWMSGWMILLAGCQPVQHKMEPILVYTPDKYTFHLLPSAFNPLSPQEQSQEWGKELLIGDAFAREMDLYRAITAYKRALILLPCHEIERGLQITYDIILCYYLGAKYEEAINIFEESELTQANCLFPAFNNLLIILYNSYREVGRCEEANELFEHIEKSSPETAQDLSLFYNLKEANLEDAEIEINCHREAESIWADLDPYYQYAKSPQKARILNALLPGAGYYYVGQKKSAVTSFVINTLFTAAAYQFFHNGYVAAGAITTSIELGWYLGGINGAGLEAQEFNTRLYEGAATQALKDHQLFPFLMFETAF
jgi:tetratricopeptide (TPR) repeat protein